MSDDKPTNSEATAAAAAPPAAAAAPPAAAAAAAVDPETSNVAAMTPEERCAYAKDLFGRGSRNYLCKEYTEAADDLSEVCTLYEEIYGNKADELGMPYLLYAKTLVALAQGGENKLLADVPEQEEEEEEDEDEDVEADNGNAGEKNNTESAAAGGAAASSQDTEAGGSSSSSAGPSTSNGTTNGSSSKAPVNGEADDTIGDGDVEEPEDDSPAANLQVAWEVLELAVQIFERQGDGSASNLADAYFELAEISLENSHFETAVRDYKKSIDIQMKLPDNNLRLIAEIEYKIGLSQMMLNAFDESVTAFRRACDVLDAEIANQKANETADKTNDNEIAMLEELKVEIVNKITEVEEAKQQSVAEVKEELAKLMSHEPKKSGDSTVSNAASGGSSSSAASATSSAGTATAAKAMDISHLVKRKKPDTPVSAADAAAEGSPAKKPAL